MDSLKTAAANIADLLDRRLEHVVDEKFNNGLTPNLILRFDSDDWRAGLHHGFKGVGAENGSGVAIGPFLRAARGLHHGGRLSRLTTFDSGCHRALRKIRQGVRWAAPRSTGARAAESARLIPRLAGDNSWRGGRLTGVVTHGLAPTWEMTLMLRLAIFDLDGTLLQDHLVAAVAEGLSSRPDCDRQAADEVRMAVRAYRSGEIGHDEAAARLHSAYVRAVSGIPLDVLDLVGKQAWQRVRERVFPHAEELIGLVRARGLRPCLLSGSPHEAVVHAGADLGVDHAWGLELADDGRGARRIRRAPARRDAKGVILTEVTRGWAVDWSGSLAMGDSPSDIAVLEMVGHPVVFEPDSELLATALVRGWPVTNRDTVVAHCRALPL
jgi:phosphoserine phosphatase